MTREEMKELLPIIQEWVEGKTLEYYNTDTGEWEVVTKTVFINPNKYRIKPEPKYRPFENKEECWNEMLKHQPFGWIYSKNKSCYYCIISVEEDRIELSPREQSLSKGPLKEFHLKNYHCFFEEALKLFKITFADGTPFGIKE